MKKYDLWEGVPPVWPQELGTEYPYVELDEAGPGDKPFVLVCPGGGYNHLAAHEGLPIADVFRRAGHSAGVLYYRVTKAKPCAPLGMGPLLDVQRAIRLVRRVHGAGRKVVVVGFSAGGHLAASSGVLHNPAVDHPQDELASFSTRPDALILCYAVISSTAKGHQGSIQTLCGKENESGLKDFFSLENRVDSETPPSFLWHTANDEAVPVENGLYFSESLSRYKIPFALHVFPDGRHGLGLAPDHPAACWPMLAIDWLKETLPA